MAVHTFDADKIEKALEAARRYSETVRKKSDGKTILAEDGSLQVRAECISLTVDNGEVCLKLPLGLGQVCLPIPSWIPTGTAAQACIDICTKWGIPCGVEVTISVAGQQIVKKGIGCSC